MSRKKDLEEMTGVQLRDNIAPIDQGRYRIRPALKTRRRVRVRFHPRITVRIRGLLGTDDWHNLFYLAADYAACAFVIALSMAWPGVGSYLLAVLVIGSRMRALDNLTHEASHKLLFRNPALNRWASLLLCSFPVGTSLHTYARSHMSHHQNLGDPELDPDLVRYRQLGVDRFPVLRKDLILHLAKVFLLTHVPRYLVGTFRAFVYSPDRPASERVAWYLYWAAVAAGLSYFGLWTAFALYWIVPFLTSFQILRYLAEISEHGGLYHQDSEMDMIRNNFCHPVWRLLLYPHSDYYHLVHHLFPGVPHFRLGRVHRILMSDPAYRKGHHCFGYFFPRLPGWKSTLDEMIKDGDAGNPA